MTLEVASATTPESQVDRASSSQVVTVDTELPLNAIDAARRAVITSLSCQLHGYGIEMALLVGRVPQFRQICNKEYETNYFIWDMF